MFSFFMYMDIYFFQSIYDKYFIVHVEPFVFFCSTVSCWIFIYFQMHCWACSAKKNRLSFFSYIIFRPDFKWTTSTHYFCCFVFKIFLVFYNNIYFVIYIRTERKYDKQKRISILKIQCNFFFSSRHTAMIMEVFLS